MSSPFPGMDPYLEDPEFFPDLHGRLISELANTLQPRLPPAYYAMTQSRVWVEYSERIIEPDVSMLRSDLPAFPGGGTAVAVSINPVVVAVPNDETGEPFIEVFTVRGEKRLVTSIELLSPSNKTPGNQGRELYLQKQRDLLRSKVHLVELDLLRGGVHSTAVPRDRAVAEAGRFDYHVCVRRFDDLRHFYVYPVRLEQRLPEIAIPLLPGDPPVTLDLQAVLDRCYENGPYGHVSPYLDRTPMPPLTPAQAEWAERLLREKGLLPPA
jgi:hypothetical protein